MPRPLRLLHPEDLLATDAALPRGRQPPKRALRWRCQSNRRQRRPQLHPRGGDHQTTGQDGPGLLRGLPLVLHPQRYPRLVWHAGARVQRYLAGGGGVQHFMLRSGPQERTQGGGAQLQV